MHTTDMPSHDYQEEQNESKKKSTRTFFDSIIHLIGASIKNRLDALRKDNRSLLTGLFIVSAASCLFTGVIAYYTMNQPKQPSNEEIIANFFNENPYYFDSQNPGDTPNDIQEFLEEWFFDFTNPSHSSEEPFQEF